MLVGKALWVHRHRKAHMICELSLYSCMPDTMSIGAMAAVTGPDHMDPGIGHEIEADLQACGYPVLWTHYFPTDPDLLDWIFADDLASGFIRSHFDISDVWPSSYSANTNEILWGAKAAARVPWIAGVIRLGS